MTPNLRLIAFQEKLIARYAEANKSAKKGQIVFVGSSSVEIFPIAEVSKSIYMQHTVYNRGVRGLTTADLLANLDTLVFDLEPSMIFMQIGANDIGNQLPEEEFLGNYDQIMTAIQERLPNTVVNIMAYYPLNPEFQTGRGLIRYTEANEAANVKVEKMAKQHGFNFINLNEGLIDEDGNLKEEYTFDGIHPLATGYEIIFRNLTPYLSGK